MVSDHVGLEIVQREVMAYQADDVERLSTPIPYRDFVAHAHYQAKYSDAEAFFRDFLGDVTEPTLPFNLRDVHSDGVQVEEARAAVPDSVAVQIRQVSKNLMISPAVLFHAAFSLVVSSCSGRDDVVFGTVLSGRLQGTSGAEQVLGMFINTLPIRVMLGGSSALALVQQIRDKFTELLAYEQASLALAQRCSGVSGDVPLFSALLNYRHSLPVGDGERSLSDSGIEVLGDQERTNYPFNLSVDDLGQDFSLEVQVDASIGAERIVGYMQTAIEQLVKVLEFEPDQEHGFCRKQSATNY